MLSNHNTHNEDQDSQPVPNGRPLPPNHHRPPGQATSARMGNVNGEITTPSAANANPSPYPSSAHQAQGVNPFASLPPRYQQELLARLRAYQRRAQPPRPRPPNHQAGRRRMPRLPPAIAPPLITTGPVGAPAGPISLSDIHPIAGRPRVQGPPWQQAERVVRRHGAIVAVYNAESGYMDLGLLLGALGVSYEVAQRVLSYIVPMRRVVMRRGPAGRSSIWATVDDALDAIDRYNLYEHPRLPAWARDVVVVARQGVEPLALGGAGGPPVTNGFPT
ncbi:uncharacterized protein THITE_2130960 [Thermothielavioides terrestris NRRL 8126]|uniref:Uncharacterized protein n=1 Tax=Thermothielavioides terrestris (strain ATCC 38088 / NRRL 8126) TaxID=578455 RepID=G2RC17_THETT|nr:uncharacterized protein THITE_2130960 [Thermothielavioides terrestris NRRL 8126]AEO69338.1 hypothetical protein THITE_2130960 [Thermothielavioides terrestris NRRL 8126]